MAGLTEPPGFGTNSWNQDFWARGQRAVLPRFVVASSSAWRPTTSTVATRTVSIASGSAWTCGVWDQTSAAETFALDANTGPTERWDAIASSAIWGTTKTRAFRVIKGTTSPPPAVVLGAPDSDSINRLPGVQYDGLVALVRVAPGTNLLPASDVVDVRMWSTGGGGPFYTPTTTLQNYLDVDMGAVLAQPDVDGGIRLAQKIGPDTWSELQRKEDTKWQPIALSAGWGGYGSARCLNDVFSLRLFVTNTSWGPNTEIGRVPGTVKIPSEVVLFYGGVNFGLNTFEVQVLPDRRIIVKREGETGVYGSTSCPL